MSDDLPRIPLGPVIDWPPVTTPRPEDTAEALYRAAERRLHTDPLFAARVTLARRVLDGVHRRSIDSHDAGWARMGAAVALLVSERPELITGTPPRRRDPARVLAEVVAPVVGYTGLSPVDVAERLLQALDVDGYEITVLADRFPHLEHTERRVRIPLRGLCGSCGRDVTRGFGSRYGELTVEPWLHIDPDVTHDPSDVVPS